MWRCEPYGRGAVDPRLSGIDAVFPIGADIQNPGKTRNYDVSDFITNRNVDSDGCGQYTSGLRTNIYNRDISI